MSSLKVAEIRHAFCRAFVQNMTGFNLTEVDGDLFSAPKTHSLAHCVGADLAMGAGIAVKFKEIYGHLDELHAQKARSGELAVLKDDERYIYYLVTKSQSWSLPSYESLQSSLEKMRDHMVKNNVHKLAIPRIGCGIDGLQWDKVTAILNDVFQREDVDITVYNFVPPQETQ
ncbi:ADP-ribose glycohydrolase OARD1 isoform X2 [Drosophila hydei]|uniref:ADP-ribose glycohydrolase OARD1 isoform X2 n=1 Tax=Drosophila hydei TaxID=7224 RepID=A0A6J1L9Q6_DROHY|nr:ADP-ribose glycohydrolase OARD1 isoform X2 [Drosophila hydei]